MRTLDFSPLYRTTVGFDYLPSIFDNVSNIEKKQVGFPPYNIEKLDQENYRITMAVAGFSESELDISVEKGVLTVTGSKEQTNAESEYLYKGIAARNFQRQFDLAEHIKVNGASMENGLLHISLQREVPEALKPRRIAISQNEAEPAKVA